MGSVAVASAASNLSGAKLADAFTSGFGSASLQIVLDRLANFINNEVNKFKNVDATFQNLQLTLKEACRLLDEVDHLQAEPLLLNLVAKVTVLSYDAIDLLDNMEREMRKQNSESKSRTPVLHAIQHANKLLMPRRIVKLWRRMDEAKKSLEKALDLNRAQEPSSTNYFDNSLLFSQPHKLIGRDEDVAAIIKGLTCSNNNESVGVSIVGMKGLGKTALAHAIMDHKDVQKTFPLILKASMSGKVFCYNDMINKLEVVHHDKKLGPNHSMNDLLILLKREPRWLLLIDDLFEMPIMAWGNFLSYYFRANAGRKVLITTVNYKVAEVSRTSMHYLKLLSDEHGRQLINQETTLPISPHETYALAKKSCGFPLVAILLARVYGQCRSCIHQDLWNLDYFRKEIIPILKLTPQSLEQHLKQCFVYFSLFPHDYHFNEVDLILLWAGAGLVQSNDEELETNGGDLFNGLLKSSLLVPLPANDEGGLIRYEMHEFIHHFAEVAGSKTYVRDPLKSCGPNSNTCHFSFSHKIESWFWNKIRKLRGLRTFLYLYDSTKTGQIGEIPCDVFKRLSRLRVLVLKNTDIADLPTSLGKLKYLRYLDISYTLVKTLPKTLYEVCTLQILRIKKSEESDFVLSLSENFSDLTYLKFIDWDKREIRRRSSLPYRIGKLSNLQKLPLFPIGDKEGYHISELKTMNDLRGSICITNLGRVANEQEANEAMLCDKPFLRRLELEWNNLGDNAYPQEVLMGLQPHESLKELQISDYNGRSLPQWLSDSLPQLEKLHLEKCHCINLPVLGQLPALKTLHLEGMCNLTILDHSFFGASSSATIGCFLSLQSLILCDMSNLKEWTGLGAQDMPLLCQLKIKDCPCLKNLPSLNFLTSLDDLQIESCKRLSSLPHFPTSLKSLSITDCDLVKTRCESGDKGINHVPSVHIDDIEISRTFGQPVQNRILQGFQSTIAGVTSKLGRLF